MANEPETPLIPIRRRAKLRLSVRSGLVAVAVVALLLAAWTSYFDPVRRWRRDIHDDNEGGRRWEAASRGVMGLIPGVDRAMVLVELTAALDDPSFRVRQTAAANLGRLWPSGDACIPRLILALKDSHPWVRRAAASSLGDFVESRAVASSPGDFVKSLQDRRDVVIPALLASLKDQDFDVRLTSAMSLARTGKAKEGLPTFIEALASQDHLSRSFAIWGIGQAGPDGLVAIPSLLATAHECASSPDPFMRLRAVEAAEVLGKFGKLDAARPILLKASTDPDPLVRSEAAKARKHLGDEGAP
jgi:HEAT repeat protein